MDREDALTALHPRLTDTGHAPNLCVGETMLLLASPDGPSLLDTAEVRVVEVPIQTPDAAPVLEAVISIGRERGMPVGAGTIVSEEQVTLSQRLGAAFAVAPGFDPDIVTTSARLGVPHPPGVATATDIQRAVRLGCRWMKALPAVVLGPQWFSAMRRGPYPEVSLVATGGVDTSNAAGFLDAGASMVAVGSALTDPEQIDRLASLL